MPSTIWTKLLSSLCWRHIFNVQKGKSCEKAFKLYRLLTEKNVKFRPQEENENKISFLDVTITREEDALTTTLFRKKYFSDVYSNFDSHEPVDCKKG